MVKLKGNLPSTPSHLQITAAWKKKRSLLNLRRNLINGVHLVYLEFNCLIPFSMKIILLTTEDGNEFKNCRMSESTGRPERDEKLRMK